MAQSSATESHLFSMACSKVFDRGKTAQNSGSSVWCSFVQPSHRERSQDEWGRQAEQIEADVN